MPFTYTGANVQDQPTFKLPPEGKYLVKIVSGEEKISRKSGKSMIELVCEIIHPDYKCRLWEYIVDNEYAQQRIHDILQSCGVVPQIGQAITAQTFVGKTGAIKLKIEKSNGEDRARIAYWCLRDASAPAPETAQNKVEDDIPF